MAVDLSQAQNYAMLKNSEAKNKTCTTVCYFFVSRANLSFMSLSNTKFLANQS